MRDVSADELLRYLSRLLSAECRRRCTRAGTRRLTCRDQAIMALRWFRDRTRIEALGRDQLAEITSMLLITCELFRVAIGVLGWQAPCGWRARTATAAASHA